jgi:predicted enzyme related to lactoylglutathione lyase
MSEQSADTTDLYGWVEIGTSDLDASQRFYSAVFGWEFQEFGDAYRTATSRGRQVGGFYQWADPIPDGVRVYVTVSDLEAVLDKVTANGGTVNTARTEISPEMGWWADFRDPAGTLVGLTTMSPAA